MTRLIWMLVVLLVLALGAYFIERPRLETEKAAREGTVVAPKLFAEISKDAISKIVINDGLSEKTIKKGDDGLWVVSDDGTNFWKTDKSKIDEVLENVTKDLTTDNLASESKDKHEKFEVTETLGTKVSVYTNGAEPAGVFFVGKQGPDYISTYVRRDGDEKVYRIPIQLTTIYGRETNGWRDKHLWEFVPSSVTEAYFKFAENAFRVKKEAEEWQLLEPETGKANGVKIESELKALSELEGAGYVVKTLEEAGLDKPESEIRLKMADGGEIAVFISAENEGYYDAYVEGKPESILHIPKADIGTLFITAVSQLKFDPNLTEGGAKPDDPGSSAGADSAADPTGGQESAGGGEGKGELNFDFDGVNGVPSRYFAPSSWYHFTSLG